ncbi:hypothetical protein [Mucilaginibacter myungsuensis]|uniref:Uncharacterized protein n=1 Tax=Mucilaginibacter myungsuensis TaxID=649104 RepID=A0A929KXY7_9SPHI|nr:hypothetical protein [Mucilaginibacter myungsuensis]MBE9662575.1 hypothetical protein [Mucilaginibacter myungsuensis]MDN3597995.1 hypothetical protein [Mucilaginibacter myungsuensis]
MDSILEITENEYLIKLNRSQFNLSFVRDLLKMAAVFSPGDEEEQHSPKENADEVEQADYDDDLEIPDRHISPDQNHNAEPDYFDTLDEK